MFRTDVNNRSISPTSISRTMMIPAIVTKTACSSLPDFESMFPATDTRIPTPAMRKMSVTSMIFSPSFAHLQQNECGKKTAQNAELAVEDAFGVVFGSIFFL